uniref:ubiquitinyl hydrolase 1 n=1 Tax=Kwoniella pini CBS 10737 TaxID=1296096 RepID=A0A1B9I2M6_9TREE|nr:uncharacterized protein I206_04279 [Kwoniella pini CBS 10737]OCF49755.1 hypothetical protein I206_04279 [Kwoniella pini CBS 10737]
MRKRKSKSTKSLTQGNIVATTQNTNPKTVYSTLQASNSASERSTEEIDETLDTHSSLSSDISVSTQEDSIPVAQPTPERTDNQKDSSSTPRLIVTAFPSPIDDLLRGILGIIHQAYIELVGMILGISSWWGGGETSSGKIENIPLDGRQRVQRRRRRVENGNSNGHVSKDDHFPGMVNLSGTLCYMNSVLQAFASITSLVCNLEKIVELAIETDTPTPVTDSLLDVIRDLNTPYSHPPPALRPHALLQALHPLPQIRRLLSTREQQDAHELFIVLAEAISDEAVKVATEIARLKGLGDILSLQQYADSKNRGGDTEGKNKRRKIRGIAQPWEGLMARRRTCQRCGWETEVRMDLVGGMELPIPLHGDVTLDSCIAEYLSPENLSDVTCEACSLRRTLAHYQNEVERLSAIPDTSTRATKSIQKSGHSSSASTSSFSPLDGLSTIASTKEDKMTNSRKKRARDARRVTNRLEEMLQSNVISNFNEPFLDPNQSKLDGTAPIPIKWQLSKTNSIRQSILTRTPQSLRLLFIRSEFTPYGSVLKKTARVNFPMILDLTKFVSDDIWNSEKQSNNEVNNSSLSSTTTLINTYNSQPQLNGFNHNHDQRKKILYRLDSVILHYGYTHSSGHYICLRRKPCSTSKNYNENWYKPDKTNKSCPDGCICESCLYFGQVREGIENKIPGKGWLRISDADVEEVGEEALYESRGAVFMLFYEKVGEYVSSEEKNGNRLPELSANSEPEEVS